MTKLNNIIKILTIATLMLVFNNCSSTSNKSATPTSDKEINTSQKNTDKAEDGFSHEEGVNRVKNQHMDYLRQIRKI